MNMFVNKNVKGGLWHNTSPGSERIGISWLVAGTETHCTWNGASSCSFSFINKRSNRSIYVSVSFRPFRKLWHTGCSLKIVFFSKYPATHPLHEGDQLIWSEIWVYSHPYGSPFPVQPIAARSLRGRGRKILKILGNKHYLMNTL